MIPKTKIRRINTLFLSKSSLALVLVIVAAVEVLAVVLVAVLTLLSLMVAEEVVWFAVRVTLVVMVAGPSSTRTSRLRGLVLSLCSFRTESSYKYRIWTVEWLEGIRVNVVDECQNYMVETTMVLGSSFFWLFWPGFSSPSFANLILVEAA